MTQIVNVSIYKGDYTYIGRGSDFGNPFKIGKDGTREEVIKKFRQYFYKRIFTDPKFAEKVETLRGCVLGCFCEPLDCHSDVIKEYLDNYEYHGALGVEDDNKLEVHWISQIVRQSDNRIVDFVEVTS